MQNYRVTYALSADENPTETQGFFSRTDISNLELVIPANGSSHAKMIVEAMFGGPARCYVKNAYPA
jgi:hypothetical protein